jgi:plasmid stabilization system protein ParE
MTFQLVVPARVEDEIKRIDVWWRRHRLAAPDLFVEELAAALELLASAPHAGRKYDHHSHEVFVLALWSALRGTGPRLQ